MRARLSALALGAFLAVSLMLALGGTISEDQANRAGLVVTFPDRTETLWIEFSEEEITGVELLERSGLDVTFSSYGGLGEAVCAIEDVGCLNPGDCYCQCKGDTCTYWVYFRLEGGEWEGSPLGASSRKLRDGDVDGWVWGSGTPPAEMLTPVPCPTATATPAPTETPPPTDPATAQPASPQASGPPITQTAAPTITPVLTATGVQTSSPGADSVGVDGEDGTASGAPVGLIAFGVVAGMMLAAGGGVLYTRRRMDG